MQSELQEEFGIAKDAATAVPFGINNSVPDTHMTSEEARQKLGIRSDEKVILFFGAIRPYKGLEHLVAAFQKLAPRDDKYRLIIAGEAKKGSEQYMRDILKMIGNGPGRERIIQKIEFIPDEETELYFKAADVSVLSYTLVFQSGVLFLSYSFGLPVVATDVGSFREDIVPGETGFLCRSCEPGDLSEAIEKYFASELFKNLENRRQKIKDYADSRNSWGEVASITRNVYTGLLRGKTS
jgi:glycosyltransferase involved in cell wall biosynthesis